MGIFIALLISLFVPGAMIWSVPQQVQQQVSTAGVPGPSQDLFNNPYYTCSTNRYVGNFGLGSPSDSNSGSTQSSPWATLSHADSLASAGWCVNIASGSYSQTTFTLTHSGSSATATGYIVYKCATMGACTLTAGSGVGGIDLGGQSYIQFDGIVVSGTPDGAASTIGINSNQASASHHIWILNSTITGFTQSGLQLNGHDFVYVIHSSIYMNAHNSCFDGSGISYWHVTASGVSLTSDDHNNPNAARLGVPSFDIGNGSTFRFVTAWNVVRNNSQADTNCPNTDGNGIIFDDNISVGYSGAGLFSFNVGYDNGGGCIHIFGSQNAWVANNSCFNSYLDPNDTGTWRGMIDDADGSTTSFPNHYYNNIGYAVVGSGNLASNSAFMMASSHGSATNNIAFRTGGSGSVDLEAGPSNGTATNANFPTASNKYDTDPLWANVGRTSNGNMTTAPNGTNFSLCTASGVPNASCTGASPAIGYGITTQYLPSTSVDAGACHHSLTTCP